MFGVDTVNAVVVPGTATVSSLRLIGEASAKVGSTEAMKMTILVCILSGTVGVLKGFKSRSGFGRCCPKVDCFCRCNLRADDQGGLYIPPPPFALPKFVTVRVLTHPIFKSAEMFGANKWRRPDFERLFSIICAATILRGYSTPVKMPPNSESATTCCVLLCRCCAQMNKDFGCRLSAICCITANCQAQVRDLSSLDLSSRPWSLDHVDFYGEVVDDGPPDGLQYEDGTFWQFETQHL